MDLALLDANARGARRAAIPRRPDLAVGRRAARRGFDAMTDLPVALRERLEQSVPFSTLTVEQEAHARDGTVKALFRTHDGRPVEAVLMRYRDGRRSLCVSSQSGCPLTCTFCATGQMRFGRNLTASEIVDQALHFRRATGPVDHAVFMGMGEPLMNLDGVLGACERLPRHRDHPPPHGDLDGRLDPGHRAPRRRPRCRSASRCRCTPRTRPCAHS